MSADTPARLLTDREAAARLGISRSHFQARYVRSGELRRIELGRSVRFDPADVSELIERHASWSGEHGEAPLQPRRHMSGSGSAT